MLFFDVVDVVIAGIGHIDVTAFARLIIVVDAASAVAALVFLLNKLFAKDKFNSDPFLKVMFAPSLCCGVD